MMQENFNYDEKVFHIDLETGGLDSKIHGVVQIAAALDLNGETVGRFDTYVKPNKGVIVTDEALSISKISRETIESAPTESVALFNLFGWLGQFISKYDKTDKALMSGFNAGFDDLFLRQMCDRNGEKYLGTWKYPDIYDTRGNAALFCLPARHLLPNFKLLTVANFLLLNSRSSNTLEEMIAKRLGIKSGEAHDARIDVEMHRMIFKIVRNGGNCCGIAIRSELEARAERERMRAAKEVK